MHPKFAEWYRPLLIQADEKLLKSRWALVESTASSLTAPMALDLVRLSFGLPVQDDAAIAALKQQLKSEELSYIRSTANLELSLIGDCALLAALDSSSHEILSPHILLAFAITCQCSIRKRITRNIQEEVLKKSRMLLNRLSVQRRRLHDLSFQFVDVEENTDRFSPQKVHAKSQTVPYQSYNGSRQELSIDMPNIKEINSGFQNIAEDCKSAMADIAVFQKTLSDNVQRWFENALLVLQTPQEENNLQWYLLGETSRDLHRPFASFELTELLPVAAKELADLTVMIPGPYAALAYLDRILTHGRSREDADALVSLRAIVESVQSLWRTESISVSGFDGVQDLTPLLCALSYATAGSNDWQTMIPQLCHVPIETELPAREMAYQLYQEILFSRLAKQHLMNKGSK